MSKKWRSKVPDTFFTAYGPCDYDPLGKTEIARQRAELRRDRRNDMDND